MTVKGWEELTPGSNPTVLNKARLQVLAMLRPDSRAVTADDFAAVLRRATRTSPAWCACQARLRWTPSTLGWAMSA